MLKERTSAGRGFDPVPMLKALAHPLRFGLVEALASGEKCVCDLVESFDASQPLVSHHLAILKKAGLVHDRQDATWVYYKLDPAKWEAFQTAIKAIRPSEIPTTPCPPEDEF
jgi:ArsR family transcriptional regulator